MLESGTKSGIKGRTDVAGRNGYRSLFCAVALAALPLASASNAAPTTKPEASKKPALRPALDPSKSKTKAQAKHPPAIASIAYFCAAELLTNTAKHSHADQVSLSVTQQGEVLWLVVADNGVGGADPEQGSGPAGLVQRTRTVDGRLDIVSPPGGPTRVTVCLPLRA